MHPTIVRLAKIINIVFFTLFFLILYNKAANNIPPINTPIIAPLVFVISNVYTPKSVGIISITRPIRFFCLNLYTVIIIITGTIIANSVPKSVGFPK